MVSREGVLTSRRVAFEQAAERHPKAHFFAFPLPHFCVTVIRMDLHRTANGNFYHPDDPGEIDIDPPGSKRLSVTETEVEILTELARGHTVLEIGTGLGVSTVALAKDHGVVWTVDPDPWVQEHIWPDLIEGGVQCFSSLETIELRMRTFAWRFSLAFIDGNHVYDAVMSDLEAVKPLLLPFCPVVLHDYSHTDVRHAAQDSGFHLVLDFGPPCFMVLGVLG